MRFARAKGSKASNERVPEEATPWGEMKRQFLQSNQDQKDSLKRQEADKERRKNYQNFLNTLEEEQAKNISWAEFPGVLKNGATSAKASKGKKRALDAENETQTVASKKLKIKSSTKKIKKLQAGGDACLENAMNIEDSAKEVEVRRLKPAATVGERKKKKERLAIDKNGEKIEMGKAGKLNNTLKKPKKNEKMEVLGENGNSEIEKKKKYNNKPKHEAEATINESPAATGINTAKSEKKKKKKLNKKAKLSTSSSKSPVVKKPPELLSSEEKLKIEKKKLKKVRQSEKRKQFKPEKTYQRRKKPQASMIYNGKEIPIAYVDGFPIKKEDADRIRKLRQEMIGKGLPQSEIKISLKLERRKAEKSFAREKKKVCFNCRKAGHNLSECPELNKDLISTAGSGICFKCGSTEHTHFECRVVKGQEFKFAKCFICQEQGHISRQCPDNAKGLYPKGGACRVCGDVTHLKKDCPKFQAQQQLLSNNFKGEVLDANDNPDDLDKPHINSVPKRANKIIKFL